MPRSTVQSILWSVLQSWDRKKLPKESAINYSAGMGSQDGKRGIVRGRLEIFMYSGKRLGKKNCKAAASILSSLASAH